MSYRDDLEAAKARATAAERQAEQLEREVAGLQQARRAGDVPVPMRLTVDETSERLVLTCRWFRRDVLAQLGAALLLFAFATITLVMWIAPDDAPDRDRGLTQAATWIVWTGPCALAGTVMTYVGVAGLVNRTRIRVDAELVRVRVGPLPWPGRRTLSTAQITRIYVGRERRLHVWVRVDEKHGTRDVRLARVVSHDHADYVVFAVGRRLRLAAGPASVS